MKIFQKLMVTIGLIGLVYSAAMHCVDVSDRMVTWGSTDDVGRPFNNVVSMRDINNAVLANVSMKTISTNFRFYFIENISIDPINNNVTFLEITSSNVTVDLRGYSITSGRTATGGTIIKIASGLSNIRILNGVISGTSGTGIIVGQGCTGIALENMTIDKCSLMGMLVDANCKDVVLKNVKISRCNGASTQAVNGAIGLMVVDSENIELENCSFNRNETAGAGNATGFYCTGSTHVKCVDCSADCNKAGTTGSAYGMRFVGGSSNELTRCQAHCNKSFSGEVSGFVFDNVDGCTITECSLSNNSARGGAFYGIKCISSSLENLGGHRIDRSVVVNNSSSQTVYGMSFDSLASCSVNECQARANVSTGTSGNAYGFYTTNCTGNSFSQCSARGMKSGSQTGNAVGFYLTGGESFCTVVQSESSGQNSPGANAYGILLDGASSCVVRDTKLLFNTGVNGYGIKDISDSSVTCFIGNFAYRNGSANGLSFNNYDIKLSPYDNVNAFPVCVAYLTELTELRSMSQFENSEIIERAIPS